jgi:hypothetical protein
LRSSCLAQELATDDNVSGFLNQMRHQGIDALCILGAHCCRQHVSCTQQNVTNKQTTKENRKKRKKKKKSVKKNRFVSTVCIDLLLLVSNRAALCKIHSDPFPKRKTTRKKT